MEYTKLLWFLTARCLVAQGIAAVEQDSLAGMAPAGLRAHLLSEQVRVCFDILLHLRTEIFSHAACMSIPMACLRVSLRFGGYPSSGRKPRHHGPPRDGRHTSSRSLHNPAEGADPHDYWPLYQHCCRQQDLASTRWLQLVLRLQPLATTDRPRDTSPHCARRESNNAMSEHDIDFNTAVAILERYDPGQKSEMEEETPRRAFVKAILSSHPPPEAATGKPAAPSFYQ